MTLTLRFHNSLSRKKELFAPSDPSAVKMYLCGPTVYDRPHLGNARSAVVFDQLYRLLKAIYPRVLFARNITDVDDKINDAARKRNLPIQDITSTTTQWYHEDMDALYVLPPTVEPRATHHIPEMIDMIQRLLSKGHAYEAEGHVLFRARSFPNYGALSGRSPDEILAGARVEVAPYKEDPADFVLWKPSDSDTPGWESPWGRGRPGWHIECSAMGEKHLGFPLDIHAGGHDLLFPHHENEVAQGECATGIPCARFWMHNGLLTIDGQKMSKSLGNFTTVEQALEHYPGEVIRYALLSSHYRQNLDWNGALLTRSQQSLDRFYTVLAQNPEQLLTPSPATASVTPLLADDLNTPQAFALLHEQATQLNKAWQPDLFKDFYTNAQLLGFFNATPKTWFQGAKGGKKNGLIDEAWIEEQITKRHEAKKARDFATADAIRNALLEQDILLEDTKAGTTIWKRR